MSRFGFVGPSYSSQSVNLDCQRTMNWYPEPDESGQGKSAMALYPTPGLSLFSTIGGPVRGGITINGRVFFVGGNSLFELMANGTKTNLGAVGFDGAPVSMAANGAAGHQVVISSAASLYYFDTTANTLNGPIQNLQGVPGTVVYCDGYFVVLLKNTNKFQVSALEDGSAWNPLGVQQIGVFPENIAAVVQAFRQLWFFGADGHSQVYYNSGANQYTPFDVIFGAYMEEGIDAPLSLCVLDNTPFWIGGNQNGSGIAWRANGYTPQRVSNFAVETAWASYPNKGSDAVGYAYKDQGHTFWVLRFPSANNGAGATWCYDASTNMWHERGYWSQQGLTGYSAHLSACHVFAFGQHLVGDWNSGNVYTLSITNLADNGTPIRRSRRAPHISTEQQRIFHSRMQVDVEVGDGPQPPLLDGSGNPRDPQMALRWSDDGGRTWSNEHWAGCGQAGDFKTRVLWNRLGHARDRVYEISVTDPIPWRVVDAYLTAAPGYEQPTERWSKMMGKMA